MKAYQLNVHGSFHEKTECSSEKFIFKKQYNTNQYKFIK